MNNEEKWKYVEQTLIKFDEQCKVLNSAVDMIDIHPESKLVSPFYSISDTLLDCLSLLVDDETKFISWFVYECDYGRHPMIMSNDAGVEIRVDSFAKLREAIELGE